MKKENHSLKDYPEMKEYISFHNKELLSARRRALFDMMMDRLMQSNNKDEREDIIEIYRHEVSFIDKEIKTDAQK